MSCSSAGILDRSSAATARSCSALPAFSAAIRAAVLALARSDSSAAALETAGAEPLRGDLADLPALRAGAARAGVRSAAVRLPRTVHNEGKGGFAGALTDGTAPAAGQRPPRLSTPFPSHRAISP